MTSKEIENAINQNTDQQVAYQKQIDELKAKLSATKKTGRTLKSDYTKAVKQEQAELAKSKPRRDLLLDAMIIGAKFKVSHGMIAPYSYGYYVTSECVNEGFCRTIDGVTVTGSHKSVVVDVAFSYGSPWYEHLPQMTYNYLINNGWGDKEFNQLQKDVDTAWAAFPTDYHSGEYKPDKQKYLHGNHIANGYETDGFSNIIAGRCGGTYSSCTTCSQNDLSRELIILKGFGFDYYAKHQHILPKELIIEVYSRHNLTWDFDDVDDWCKKNPTRCMPESRYFVNR